MALTIQSAAAASRRTSDEPGLDLLQQHQVRGEFAQQATLQFCRLAAAEV